MSPWHIRWGELLCSVLHVNRIDGCLPLFGLKWSCICSESLTTDGMLNGCLSLKCHKESKYQKVLPKWTFKYHVTFFAHLQYSFYVNNQFSMLHSSCPFVHGNCPFHRLLVGHWILINFMLLSFQYRLCMHKSNYLMLSVWDAWRGVNIDKQRLLLPTLCRGSVHHSGDNLHIVI